MTRKMKYNVDCEYLQADDKFAFVVTPMGDATIPGHRSKAVYQSSHDALFAGVQYLESQGTRNIDWHAVATILM